MLGETGHVWSMPDYAITVWDTEKWMLNTLGEWHFKYISIKNVYFDHIFMENRPLVKPVSLNIQRLSNKGPNQCFVAICCVIYSGLKGPLII